MIPKHRSLFCVALLAFAALAPIDAATVYRESVSGDLSNSGLTPTVLPVSVGSNQIFGTTGRVTATDRDYFTITVPTGLQISEILELGGTAVGDAVSFFGIQRGSQVTVPTNAATADGLLGWTHYGPVTSETDIMPELQVPAEGSTGFTGALPAGNYAFWIQDFGAGTFSYAFDVRLTAATTAPVPEPASYASALLGALFLALVLRRYRHSHL
ncbi:MAG: PEP-CTERM sorting domain-containing protein [Bryobacteraceae bacterium]